MMPGLLEWWSGFATGLCVWFAAATALALWRRLRRPRGVLAEWAYADDPAEIPWCFTCGVDAQEADGRGAAVALCGVCYTSQGGSYGVEDDPEAVGLKRLHVNQASDDYPCECPGPATVEPDGSACLRCGKDAGAKR